MSASSEEHRAQAPRMIRCAVVTVSDTRTPETDRSGTLIRQRLAEAGHAVIDYRIVPDEPREIGPLLDELASREDCDAVLIDGGTGIARRDTTYDVVAARLDKRLDGFGELFRSLSYAEIGAAAMLSRATGGVYRGTLVLLMPGSSNAVALAMDRLILPELGHLVFEIRK